MNLVLNADLGEGEPLARTRALMDLVGAANIACGGHAGTVSTMNRSVSLALEAGVRIGAHPGLSTLFGRAPQEVEASELELIVLQQVGALAEVAKRHGTAVDHVKLHGSLYHASEVSVPMARCYVSMVSEYFPGLAVIARAGGLVVREADRAGVEAWGEVFAERGYLDDGRLIPRGEPGDLITDPAAVAARVRDFVTSKRMTAFSGALAPEFAVRTLCVHADSPNAVAIARAVTKVLKTFR